MEETKTPVKEIFGLGLKNEREAITHIREIAFGYSMFAAQENNDDPSEDTLRETRYNISILDNLLQYALNGFKFPNDYWENGGTEEKA